MNFSNDSKQVGILLINLGTPEAPTPEAVRRYLAEFLWDPPIVDIPRFLWWFILHGIILRRRPKKSAEAYQKIWLAEGSPLLVNTRAQAKALQARLNKSQHDTGFYVDFAMRYGEPCIFHALKKLTLLGLDQIIVLPMYPQYSTVSTASALDDLQLALAQIEKVPTIKIIEHYADHQGYINALAQQIESNWQDKGKGEKLLLSFHGIPQKRVDGGDPYYQQCMQTTKLLVEKLGLKPSEYEMVFQSRFGVAKWLQPYCVERLQELAKEGIKKLDIVCPGFSADCLETLEEIVIQNNSIFIESGGETLNYVPALNAEPMHIDFLEELILYRATNS